jgi:hypothetical protein
MTTPAFEPRQGIKVDQELKKQLEASRIATQSSDGPDVAGQRYYNGYTRCPYCGNVGWTNGLNTRFYINVSCGRCGSLFIA